LKTNLSITVKLDSTLKDLVNTVSEKTGENFNSEKMFVVIPVGGDTVSRNQFLP